jgi:hypothetical protein
MEAKTKHDYRNGSKATNQHAALSLEFKVALGAVKDKVAAVNVHYAILEHAFPFVFRACNLRMVNVLGEPLSTPFRIGTGLNLAPLARCDSPRHRPSPSLAIRRLPLPRLPVLLILRRPPATDRLAAEVEFPTRVSFQAATLADQIVQIIVRVAGIIVRSVVIVAVHLGDGHNRRVRGSVALKDGPIRVSRCRCSTR